MELLKPDKALLIIQEIVNNVKCVNGTFISIWHNEALSIARFRNVQTRQTLVTKRAGFGVFNVTIDGNTLIDNKCFFGRPI